ncbi:MAG: acyloxyacyl hydrolase [Gammaproteobacteria bacterium]|nr:acyloxyacyl hydrolase [Gammaproteobacteria bacterium]
MATTAALIATTNPLKARGMTTEIGGGDHVSVVRAGAQWDWNDDLLEVFGWNVSSYWQLDFSRWQSTLDASQTGVNMTVGLTPMFRFTGKKGYVQPYLDVGVGVNLFTVSRFQEHEFGSNFQFSDQFSVGANIGKRNQWGFAYKFQHYSNGSVRVPNKGINFHFLTLTYQY